MESVSFTQVGIFFGCVMVLMGAAFLWNKLSRGDPPYATKDEIEVTHRRIDKLRKEMRDDVHDLHKKIDSTAAQSSEILGQVKMINQHTASLNNQFSSFLQNQAKRNSQ